jgi:hypothetical protein
MEANGSFACLGAVGASCVVESGRTANLESHSSFYDTDHADDLISVVGWLLAGLNGHEIRDLCNARI